MRIILEVLIAAGLIAAAWHTPYSDYLSHVVPSLAATSKTASSAAAPEEERHSVANPQPVPVAADSQPAAAQAPSATASPSASANWMWDAKRPGSLDRPGQTATPTVFTKHIYYTDEKGKKYWLDARGNRHYD